MPQPLPSFLRESSIPEDGGETRAASGKGPARRSRLLVFDLQAGTSHFPRERRGSAAPSRPSSAFT